MQQQGHQTPKQPSRVRQVLPEASPFSSVLACLPSLSPPRKYVGLSSFGTLHTSLNPVASPHPSTFGYNRLPASSQTPGGPNDAKAPLAPFDLLNTSTPIKSLPPPEAQLSSPRFDLASPKFPLFQPSPKKPLSSLRSPPTVRHGESNPAGMALAGGSMGASFHQSPFSSILDGSSRSAPSPIPSAAAAAGAGAGDSSGGDMPPPRRPGSAGPRPSQQRFHAIFSQGDALDAAAGLLGSGEIPPPSAGLDPTFLSPLRPAASGGLAAAARRTSSTGSGTPTAAGAEAAAAAAAAAAGGDAGPGLLVPQPTVPGGSVDMAGLDGGHRRGSVGGGGGADMAEDEVDADVAMYLDEDEDDGEEVDDADDEDFTLSGSFRQPASRSRRQAPTPGGAAQHAAAAAAAHKAAAQKALFVAPPPGRPTRRRALMFAGGGGGRGGGDEDEVEATPLVHSHLPQSPMCQPIKLDVDSLQLLPIPKLQGASTATGGGGSSEDGSGSPTNRMRPSAYSLDSPAVQAAAHAAVSAALAASTGTAATSGQTGGAPSRRPQRAASIGAAIAAKKAAEASSTPVRRSTLARSGSSGALSLSSALPPLTPGEEGGAAPAVVFSGPKKCNCKKSKCLKLYCDCFANGGFCGPACSCANCANKVENSDLVRAQREAIKQRNPNAFVQKIEADATMGGQHRRGCNCKKSHCMKKYCECFQAGVPCGEHCKCEACHNTSGHAARRPPGGGASKRSRSSAAAATQQQATRQHYTRNSAGAGANTNTLSQQQLRAVHAAAALQAAMAQASAGMAAAAGGEGGAPAAAADSGGAAPAAGQEGRQQQQQQAALLFPLMQQGMIKGEGGSSQMQQFMIPVMLPQGGASGAPALLGQQQSQAAGPALAAFAAAAGPQDAAAAAAGVPSHNTPVSALVGPAAVGATTGKAAAAAAGADGGGFSFHPASAADGSGSSSGHSTPRAAAAADLGFSLDTPAAIAAAAAAGAGAHATALEKLLPATNMFAGAPGTVPSSPAAAAAPVGVRQTPTKRKPARTMTAALM